jgi:hypothetical protein
MACYFLDNAHAELFYFIDRDGGKRRSLQYGLGEEDVFLGSKHHHGTERLLWRIGEVLQHTNAGVGFSAQRRCLARAAGWVRTCSSPTLPGILAYRAA